MDVGEQPLGRPDGGSDREELLRIEDAAEIRPTERVSDVLRAAKARRGLRADQRLGRGGLVLQPLGAGEVRLRAKGLGALASRPERRPVREQLADGREFERAEGLLARHRGDAPGEPLIQ